MLLRFFFSSLTSLLTLLQYCFCCFSVKFIYLFWPPWVFIGLPKEGRICLRCRRHRFNSWVGKSCWRRDRLPTPVFLGFTGGSAGKESACRGGDLGSTPGLGRSPGEGKGYPLQDSGLENSMDSPWDRRESDATERLSLHWVSAAF